MRFQLTVTFAALALAVSFEASAYTPARAPTTKNEDAQLAAQKRDQELYREFMKKRQELEKTGPQGPDPWTQRSKITVKPHEIEMRIERYMDGTILYSTPVDKKYESLLFKGQMFRKVEKQEEINDRTVYNDRVYRVMRARGSPEQWKDAIGQNSVVTLQTEGGSQIALRVRVKR
jgi:hypothetical protein